MIQSPPANTPAGAKPISVMVVDDSAIIRGLITRTLEKEGDIKVTMSAGDGIGAIKFLSRTPVDVILLDIEMPNMDGITAIPKLLEVQPDVKIIMASTLSLRNAEISMKALSLGAVDYIPKPSTNKEVGSGVDFNRDVVDKVRAWARKKGPTERPAAQPVSAAALVAAQPAPMPSGMAGHTKPVVLRNAPITKPEAVAIASSTGGPQALFKVMPHFKGIKIPVFITQHMPPSFTTILASNIKNLCGVPCEEAQEGMEVKAGQVYLAPGNFHMTIKSEGIKKVIRLNQDPPENFCRPAADPMLRSISALYGPKVLAIVLTGMGSDGLRGCEVVTRAQGTVLAQDQPSSVVWGMPGSVAEAGLAQAMLPLDQIGSYAMRIVEWGHP
jgi:two-component system chemotaxis response regulator CheB